MEELKISGPGDPLQLPPELLIGASRARVGVALSGPRVLQGRGRRELHLGASARAAGALAGSRGRGTLSTRIMANSPSVSGSTARLIGLPKAGHRRDPRRAHSINTYRDSVGNEALT